MTEFELWAPTARRVRLRLGDDTVELTRDGDGWWRASADAPPGTDYAYLLDDSDTPRPDPRSRWQPAGVHGPSRVYDEDAFAWSDADWAGRDLVDASQFEDLLNRARAVSDPRARATLLAEALGLWRGAAFADFGDQLFTQAAIGRLERMLVLPERP